MEELFVIKIGGSIVDDDGALASFLQKFSVLGGKKILVHGGGKLATRVAEKLEIPQQLVQGRRITDSETLKVVTMVYAGYINKNIVAQLQSLGDNAVGICGADGDSIRAHKRSGSAVDYGFAGDIDVIHVAWISRLLDEGNTLVVAPITHDGEGQLLNTNADTVACELARALSAGYQTSLVFGFEKSGVLADVDDEESVIPRLKPAAYRKLLDDKKVFAGMIPKLENAFSAISNGVGRVIIGRAENLETLLSGDEGTTITHE